MRRLSYTNRAANAYKRWLNALVHAGVLEVVLVVESSVATVSCASEGSEEVRGDNLPL